MRDADRRARRRLLWTLSGGVALLVVLALSDYFPPGADWFAAHPMTASTVSTVITFVAVGLLVEQWLKERSAAQLRLISSVAYRSLAQAVNDAGRSLLAPLVGADLAALAVPSGDDVTVVRARLLRHGLEPTFDQSTGSWRGIGAESHDHVLRTLCTEAAYVQALFRTAAVGRRRLHDATAMWAPVMLNARSTSDDLGTLRQLTDAMELLQERCRLSGVVGRDVPGWVPDTEWLDHLSRDFWAAVSTYELLRDDFAELAELPSDEIVLRRA
jgi:hypothetical protein